MLARCHATRGDYRSALHAEKETYSVYNTMFGPDHEKTKESSETLKILTQQAVSFQKTMMDPSKATSLAHLIPLQVFFKRIRSNLMIIATLFDVNSRDLEYYQWIHLCVYTST